MADNNKLVEMQKQSLEMVEKLAAQAMDEFRKEAYKKYLLWDIASMAGLLFFVPNFSQEGSMMLYIGLVLYFIGSKQKGPYRAAYLGDVTKEDVEAAKAAADEE